MGLFGSIFKTGKKMCKSYSNIKATEKLTYDRLFEIMKKGTYPLGEPQLTGNGIMRAIRFDATGKYQVMTAITGKTITVSKTYSGVGGLAKEIAGDAVTDGWYSGINKENMDGNEAVEVIGEEIHRLLEAEGLAAK